MDITFSQSTITGYILSGILSILLTVVFIILWKVKTKAPVFPIIVGAITFVLFAEILKVIPLYPLIVSDNSVSRTINSTPVLYYLIAALSAGIFEETGRYIAFRFVLKKHTERRTSLDYAVGHGGIEALITSVTPISIAVLGTMANNGMLSQILSSNPEQQQAKVIEQLTNYASHSFGVTMLWIPERISAVIIHLALSVLLFRAVRDKKFILYPIAVLIHFAIDFCTIFYTDHPVLTELFFPVVSVVLIVTVIKTVYRKMPESTEVTE
ncbi:MAG: YhfC family intramembrane metalloprotease [Oscillospiraceae bacterium]|nr:YhfC family intramembrane metalloprotease [Oscillospiraceae bacterium]